MRLRDKFHKLSDLQIMEELADYYYLGFYQKVATDGSKPEIPEEGQFMVYRSNLALGKVDYVINQTRRGDSPMAKGINILANVMKMEDNDTKVKYITDNFDIQAKNGSQYYTICITICYLLCNKPGDALELIHDLKHPEAGMIRIQALLALDRPELASEEIPNISNKALSDIAQGVVAIRTQENLNKAINDLLDQHDRYSQLVSPLLDSLIATCRFLLNEKELAIGDLAQDVNQFPNDPNVIINDFVLSIPSADAKQISDKVALVNSTKCQYSSNIAQMLEQFDQKAAEIAE